MDFYIVKNASFNAVPGFALKRLEQYFSYAFMTL